MSQVSRIFFAIVKRVKIVNIVKIVKKYANSSKNQSQSVSQLMPLVFVVVFISTAGALIGLSV